MSYLLARETWPVEAGVRGVAYFCGVLDGQLDSRAEASNRAKDNARSFLEKGVRAMWPTAAVPGGMLDWSLLADPRGRNG